MTISKNRFSKWLAMSGISIILFGCATVGRDWEAATSEDTIVAYELFLENHPDADQAGRAKSRMEKLQAEADWRGAETENTVEAYKTFLEKHPQSKQAGVAKSKMEALVADLDWKNAKSSNTIETYEMFIEKHPESTYAEEAEREFKRLSAERDWLMIQDSASIETLTEFLRKYPTSEHASEARIRRSDLQAEKAWETAKKSGSDSGWMEFIMAYPESPKIDAAVGHLKEHRVVRADGLISWDTLGGMTLKADEDASDFTGATVANVTTMRLPGIPMTIDCNGKSELNFPHWVKINGIMVTGKLKGGEKGMTLVSGMAMVPDSR